MACLHRGGGPQIGEVAGHPTYHVNVFKLKSLREIIWTGG